MGLKGMRMNKINQMIGVGALVSLLFFLWFPDCDLMIADLFFSGHFVSGNSFFEWVYRLVRPVTILVFTVLLLDIGFYFFTKKHLWMPVNSTIFFLLCWLLGPGLFVNLVAKDKIGRPRPSQVVPFHGEFDYVPPFSYSSACSRNCSFVSGHASVGFVFAGLAFVFRTYRKTILLSAIASGSVIGYVRMAQGGHFFSDVVFSFFATYLGILCALGLMRMTNREVVWV